MVLGEEEQAINSGDSAMILVLEDGLCKDGGAGKWMVGLLYTSCVVAVFFSENVLEVPSGMWNARCREGEDCGIEESDTVADNQSPPLLLGLKSS
jgi:hypothetical protein